MTTAQSGTSPLTLATGLVFDLDDVDAHVWKALHALCRRRATTVSILFGRGEHEGFTRRLSACTDVIFVPQARTRSEAPPLPV